MDRLNPESVRLDSDDYTLRPVTAQDAEGLQRDCWTDWPIEIVTEVLERVERLAGQRRGLGIVAVHGEYVLGYGQLTVWPRIGEISDLIVAPGYRSQGIGSKMIAALIDKARAWNLPVVEIGAALSNPRALALYRRLGFVEQRRIDLDLGNGPEAVIYLIKTLQGQEPR